MTELLAPAGNFEALEAAISNGANAIYLGMPKFGARAYASNFTIEELKKAVNYAHLRNVKVYVTMNTIVFDKELNEAYEQIKELYLAGVDGVIVQDLALLTHIINNYPKMEAHASTQMGIDDLEGTLLLKELGCHRVVLSREVEIAKIQEIKQFSKMPLEVFIHGALCVSYSGNCLMSGLIGYRSGNRGRCVGSCRKEYELIDVTNNINYPKSYILSMKDLNTSYNIKDLKNIDSLKIEGRMKESVYVANVVKSYRELLDNPKADINENNIKELLDNEEDLNPNINMSSYNLCYCIYTSGSTGNPKAAGVYHRNAVNFCTDNKRNNLQHHISLNCNNVLACGAIVFDIFNFETMLSLLLNKTIVLASEEVLSNVNMLANLVYNNNIDCVHCTPTKLQAYLDNQKFDSALVNVKCVMLGGEALTSELCDKLCGYSHAKVFNGYGPTETTMGVSFGEIDSQK